MEENSKYEFKEIYINMVNSVSVNDSMLEKSFEKILTKINETDETTISNPDEQSEKR